LSIHGTAFVKTLEKFKMHMMLSKGVSMVYIFNLQLLWTGTT